RPPEDREILRENVDEPTLDRAVPGHYPVAQILLVLDAEIGGPVDDEAVQLDQRALVERHSEALAGSELAACVLLFDAVIPSALLCIPAKLLELLQSPSHRHAFTPRGLRAIVMASDS